MRFHTTGSVRLVSSVAAVLALTAGTGLLAAPPAAASSAGSTAVPFPSLLPGTSLLSAGARGYVLRYVPTGNRDYIRATT
ncbi:MULTISPECIES: hypothetical protein [unclassified Streptomyces]|uniref:hypothetical protein n=1 Tax=unclassified Streptomyces TaxID=2593676 RepID=UPI0036F9667E